MCKLILIVFFSFFFITQINAKIERNVSLKEKISFSNDEKCSGDSVKTSPDAQKVAIACRSNITGKYYWKINNKKLIEHDDLGSVFYFAPNSKNYSYIAIEDTKRIIVYNGEKYNLDSQAGSSMVFSSDSTKVMSLVVNSLNKSQIVINGKIISREWNYIDYMQFSPNSKKYMYLASDGEYAYLIENEKILFKEKIRYMINTKENLKKIANFIDLIYSPDSSKIAYTSFFPEKGMCLNINGKQVSEYFDEIGSIMFGPNSIDYAFIGYKLHGTNKAVFVKNEIQSEDFDSVNTSIDLNRKGELAYIGKKDNNFYFVKNNEKKLISSNSDIFGTLKYSPDGKRYFYYVENNNLKEAYLEIDGKETKRFETIGKLFISKDSKYFFYIGIKRRSDRKYQSEIFINTELNGNGKYEYFKIYDLYYDVNQNKLFYPVILINDPNSIYIMEENIIENNRPASN